MLLRLDCLHGDNPVEIDLILKGIKTYCRSMPSVAQKLRMWK